MGRLLISSTLTEVRALGELYIASKASTHDAAGHQGPDLYAAPCNSELRVHRCMHQVRHPQPASGNTSAWLANSQKERQPHLRAAELPQARCDSEVLESPL